MEVFVTPQPPSPHAILRDCKVGDVIRLLSGPAYYRILMDFYTNDLYLYALSSACLYPMYSGRTPHTPVIMVKNCKFTGEEV